MTLDQDHLRSTTTSRCDPGFTGGDKLWLNGKEDEIKEGGRLSTCIRELRSWRRAMEDKDASLPRVSFTPWPIGRGRVTDALALGVDAADRIVQQLPDGRRSGFIGVWVRGAGSISGTAVRAAAVGV